MIKVWLFVALTLGIVVVGIILLIRGKRTCCADCGYPVREGWVFCPKCGSNVNSEGGFTMETKKQKREMVQICGVLIGIPMFCYLIIGLILIPMVMNQQLRSEVVYNMTSESVASDELQDWFDQCDSLDDDVECYILRQDVALSQGEVADTRCSYVIYINADLKLTFDKEESWAGKERIELVSDEDGQKGYVIAGYTDYCGNFEHQIKIDGEKMKVSVEDVGESEMNLERIAEDVLQ